MEKEIATITGRFVSRLNNKSMYNNDFCVNKIHVKENENLPLEVLNKNRKGNGWDVTVTGYNLPTSKAKYYGEWVESKYGKQFKVSTYEFVTPDTKKGIVSFLSSKTFKGVGRRTAEAIVNEFGMQSIDVIKDSPERLLVIKGLDYKKINALSSKLKVTEYYNKLALYLNTYGNVESSKIMKIANKFGEKALEEVKNNPFCITEVEGVGFTTADNVAKSVAQTLKVPADVKKLLGSYQRISSATKHELKSNSVRTGGTYTLYNDIFNMVFHLLNDGLSEIVVTKEELTEAFKKMKESKDIIIFNIDGKVEVFDVESNKDEKDTAFCLMNMLSIPIPEKEKEEYERAFNNIEEHTTIPFSDDQKQAISNILKNKVSILNGGPGTGKSTCLKAIIDCYKAVNGRGASVTQVAPTGKAARRMTESTGLPADTIHRTCGIYTNTDLYNGGNNSIPEGLVICDETSMVDSAVMRCLVSQIKPEKSKLILVGDSDQLPSVGAGAVLRDLIDSERIPTYKLTVNHRQANGAGLIIENARKMNEGNTNLVFNEERFKLIQANNEDDALEKILKAYDEECKKWGIDNVAILCPRRQKVKVCVDNINSYLQNIVNPKVDGDTSITIGSQEFRVRDRVIQMKNTEFASNGDIGIIKSISFEKNDSDDGELIVRIAFEGGNQCEYNVEDMANVNLAYALTIHKSQGSEYKSVIMPFLSSQKCPLFQRNLIYTGTTRCKEKLTIVGDINAINTCIKSNEGTKRNTLLKTRIQKYK
jgi:exodeoxyribonuclease V alpha subunit